MIHVGHRVEVDEADGGGVVRAARVAVRQVVGDDGNFLIRRDGDINRLAHDGNFRTHFAGGEVEQRELVQAAIGDEQ